MPPPAYAYRHRPTGVPVAGSSAALLPSIKCTQLTTAVNRLLKVNWCSDTEVSLAQAYVDSYFTQHLTTSARRRCSCECFLFLRLAWVGVHTTFNGIRTKMVRLRLCTTFSGIRTKMVRPWVCTTFSGMRTKMVRQ